MKRILALLAVSACAAFAQTPAVTEILNNYGLINAGTVAQGAIFIVKGSNLSDQTTTLQSVPLQTTLVGVRMEITVSGTTVFAPMYYALPQQLAGILPSNTPVGTGTLIVRNNGRSSAARPITVVRSAFGMLTINGAGTGMAAVHNDAYALLAANNATNPGKAVVFYGSGLGPTAGNETVEQTGVNASGDLTSIPITVNIGGKTAQVLYRGRTIFPGLDQINVVIPQLDSYSCDVSVIITTNGVQANAGSIPVAASGSTCTNPNPGGGGGNSGGLTQGQIDGILARGVYKSGQVSVGRTTTYYTDYLTGTPSTQLTREDGAYGSFASISGPDLAQMFSTNSLPNGFQAPAAGVCNFFDTQTIPSVVPNVTYAGLDAGAALTVQGPAGSRTIPRSSEQITGVTYSATVGNGTPGNYQDPGSYTFTGPGGPQVGSFNISVAVAPELVWTNREANANVTRSNGMTITWTGGEPTQLVFITGISVSVDTGGNASGKAFQCYANQSAGSFTVPASILTRLPATTAIEIPGFGSIIAAPGFVSLSSVGKVTWQSNVAGLDTLSATSSSSIAASVVFR